MKKAVIFTLILLFITPTVVFAEFSDAIIGQTKNATIAIFSDDMLRGTGFFINRGGLILTNRHIIWQKQNLWILLFNKKKFEVELLWADGDLALLKPIIPDTEANIRFPFLKFTKEFMIFINKPVLAIGHNNNFWQIIKGSISGWRNNLEIKSTSFSDKINAVEYKSTILAGFSGGPLIDEDGDVVEINTASDDLKKSVYSDHLFSYAISIADIKMFVSDFDRMSPLIYSTGNKQKLEEKDGKTECTWAYEPEGRWCRNY